MSTVPPCDETPVQPKTPMPPLDARAARPKVVRLRRSVVAAAVMGACGLLAGSLAWAFIVEPQLRARASAHRLAPPAPDAHEAVRPSDRVTGQPATYSQLAALPPPRSIGPSLSVRPPPAAEQKPDDNDPYKDYVVPDDLVW